MGSCYMSKKLTSANVKILIPAPSQVNNQTVKYNFTKVVRALAMVPVTLYSPWLEEGLFKVFYDADHEHHH